MRNLQQQMYDAAQIEINVHLAADRGYLSTSKDELQIRAISQLTLAILMLVKVLTERTEEEC